MNCDRTVWTWIHFFFSLFWLRIDNVVRVYYTRTYVEKIYILWNWKWTSFEHQDKLNWICRQLRSLTKYMYLFIYLFFASNGRKCYNITRNTHARAHSSVAATTFHLYICTLYAMRRVGCYISQFSFFFSAEVARDIVDQRADNFNKMEKSIWRKIISLNECVRWLLGCFCLVNICVLRCLCIKCCVQFMGTIFF